MKLYDVMRRWATDPSTKFYCIHTEEVWRLENGLVLTENNEKRIINKTTLNFDFEEIKEPVSFIEAVESEKRVRVEHPYISQPYEKSELSRDYQYLGAILDILSAAWGEDEIRKIILEGDWYIEN